MGVPNGICKSELTGQMPLLTRQKVVWLLYRCTKHYFVFWNLWNEYSDLANYFWLIIGWTLVTSDLPKRFIIYSECLPWFNKYPLLHIPIPVHSLETFASTIIVFISFRVPERISFHRLKPLFSIFESILHTPFSRVPSLENNTHIILHKHRSCLLLRIFFFFLN